MLKPVMYTSNKKLFFSTISSDNSEIVGIA